jgi:hypothetical protein
VRAAVGRLVSRTTERRRQTPFCQRGVAELAAIRAGSRLSLEPDQSLYPGRMREPYYETARGTRTMNGSFVELRRNLTLGIAIISIEPPLLRRQLNTRPLDEAISIEVRTTCKAVFDL